MRSCQYYPASCPVSAEIGRNGPRPLTGYLDDGWRDAMRGCSVGKSQTTGFLLDHMIDGIMTDWV